MTKISRFGIFFAAIAIMAVCTGCVERELTINTVPQGANVILNDQEIGMSPVTVDFEWYGDYKIRIEKKGYETLVTHQCLKRPSHDYFPFDMFEGIFNPDRIDSYCWEFDLKTYQPTDRNVLIQNAKKAKLRTTQAMAECKNLQNAK